MEILKNLDKSPAGSTLKSNHFPSYYIHSAGLFLLILLWSYAVFVKLADLTLFQRQMHQQPFRRGVTLMLIFAVPILEAAAAILLILNKRKWGLWISILLLLAFTGYVILVLADFFPNTPCSCGGLISKMTWKTHLWFNVFFLVFNVYCLFFEHKRKGGREAKN